MKDKIDEMDLLKAQLLQSRMELAAVKAEHARDALTGYLDSLSDKYGLRKGIDQIHPDGWIERGPLHSVPDAESA